MHKKNAIPGSIAAVIILTTLIALCTAHWTPGEFRDSFRMAAIIALPFVILSLAAWNWGGKGKALALLMLATFGLHLGFGLATVNLLPEYGHPDNTKEQKGFLFDDAYRRDEEAWTISVKEEITFIDTLTREYHNDQYGGLAALSLWLYEYISPDVRRFTLIMLVAAFFPTLGLPFFRKALNDRWGRRVSLIGCLIYTLYPDSIFFSGAPMREPFLIGILAVAFWALATLRDHKKRSGMILVLCVLSCLPFSSMVAGALVCAAVLWIWAEMLVPRGKVWLWIGIVLVILGILLSIIVALPAFKEWIHYDIHTTERGSGWVEKVIGEIGGQFRSLFVAVYGLTQPVLPAILVYPVAPACDLAHGPCTTIYWKVVGIFRSAGWYILVPFLFYAIFATLRIKDKKEKVLMMSGAVFVLVWMFIASLRAGGDQTDNPRYRVIFLPWLAFYAAWGIDFAIKFRDWWLIRWIAIELIFLGFFTQWYYSRYSGNAIRRYPFWRTVIYICICSAAVFATGIIEKIRNKEH